MPYKVEKRNDKWVVFNPDTGKVYGTHDSKADAEAQRKALYANASPEDETKKIRIKLKK